MELDIQIKTLIYSFVFGGIFYFLLDIFNKFTNKKGIIIKIILSFLFILLISLLYFIILLYVNNGYIHIYFLISILVGYIFVYFLYKKLFTFISKKNKC